MEYVGLFAGFFLLIYSGKYLVNGGVAISEKLGISKLVIGVTVVSFGTSAPELFVSLIAAIRGHSSIAIGNVVGSNISNIALVLALTAIIFPIKVRGKTVRVLWPIMMTASIFLYLFLADLKISRTEGVLFFTFLVFFIIFSVWDSKKSHDAIIGEISSKLKISWAIVLILLASAGLALGSHLLVNNAVIIAEKFHVSERIISITLIAVGTSLPELATSVIAAFNKEMDISVGNIVGSNIFNIWAVLGITSIIQPIQIDERLLMSFDILWMLGISVLLFIFILPFKGGIINRWKGFIMFFVYCTYIYLLLSNKSI